MTRVRKQTERFNPNPHQKKKQQQKEVLQKRIQKQQVIHSENLQRPLIEAQETIEIIRDDNANIYDGLYYNDKDIFTRLIRLVIQEYPMPLPPIFKGLVPLYIEKKPMETKQKVYLSRLEKGDYQTASSKSDKGIAKGIRTLLNMPDLQKYDNDDLTDFIKNHREVFFYILKRCKDEKLSLPTLKGYIIKLMRVLLITLKTKKAPVYVKYASILKDLSDAVENIDNNNTLNENEMTRFLEWKYVIDKQKELSKDFDNIINKQTREAYDLNLDLVLISLYTLTPPLRRENMNLHYKQNGDTINKDYVNVRKNDVKLEFNLNKKRHDPIVIECNIELANILRKSYELYPRTYVFTTTEKFPNTSSIKLRKLTEGAVAERLTKMFSSYGVNIGASILRASYVSGVFEDAAKNKTQVSSNKIKEMARLMRTSEKYIQTSYRKIKPPDAIDIDELVQNSNNNNNQILSAIPYAPKISKIDPYVMHNQYMVNKYNSNGDYKKTHLEQQKEYREKTGKFELQKRKTISMLKNSVSYRGKIKQETLNKYNIKLSDFE